MLDEGRGIEVRGAKLSTVASSYCELAGELAGVLEHFDGDLLRAESIGACRLQLEEVLRFVGSLSVNGLAQFVGDQIEVVVGLSSRLVCQ